MSIIRFLLFAIIVTPAAIAVIFASSLYLAVRECWRAIPRLFRKIVLSKSSKSDPKPPIIITDQPPPPRVSNSTDDADPGVNALPILSVNLPEHGPITIGGVIYWNREGQS